MTSTVVYSTSTESAAAADRRRREGIVATCSWCDRQVRLYVDKLPEGEIVCGPCQDWG